MMRRSVILTSAALTASALQKSPLRRPELRLHAVSRESQWQWQEDSKWTERENTIRYASEGPVDGPPVLFLHGFGSSLETYRDNAPALAAAGYRCHRLDLLGLGLSEKAPGPYSIGRWRQQAAAIDAPAGDPSAVTLHVIIELIGAREDHEPLRVVAGRVGVHRRGDAVGHHELHRWITRSPRPP